MRILGDTPQTRIHGIRKTRQQTRSWNYAEQRRRQKIIDTEYINERAITTTILVNHQRIKVMSVYFPRSGYADHHVDNMYRTIEKHTTSKNHVPIFGGDVDAELEPGNGIECTNVSIHTLNEGNKRGDWMKQWLMLQNFKALNTIWRKTPGRADDIQIS